jgi:hypothetical protein
LLSSPEKRCMDFKFPSTRLTKCLDNMPMAMKNAFNLGNFYDLRKRTLLHDDQRDEVGAPGF